MCCPDRDPEHFLKPDQLPAVGYGHVFPDSCCLDKFNESMPKCLIAILQKMFFEIAEDQFLKIFFKNRNCL